MRAHFLIATAICFLLGASLGACDVVSPDIELQEMPPPPQPDATDRIRLLWSVRVGKLSAAKEHLQNVLAANRRKPEFESEILAEVVEAGWPKSRLVTLYAMHPSATMFRLMYLRVGDLSPEGWSDQFGELLKAHLAKVPGDPLAQVAKGRWHFHRGEFALADKEFEAAVGKNTVQADLDECRFHRVASKLHTGNVAAVLEAFSRDDWGTGRVLGFCRRHDRLDVYERLLAKETEKGRDEFVLSEWIRLRLLQGRILEAARLDVEAMNLPRDPRNYGHVLHKAIAGKGGIQAAYDAVRDRPSTWEALRDSFEGRNHVVSLELRDCRRRDVPDDPWLLKWNPAMMSDMHADKKRVNLELETWRTLTDREKSTNDGLSQAYAAVGRWQDAVRTMPTNADALGRVAQGLLEARQWPSIREFLTAYGSKLDQTLFLRMNACERIHAASWKEAHAWSRKMGDAKKELRSDYLEMGRPIEAIHLYRKEPRLFPTDWVARKLIREKKPDQLHRLILHLDEETDRTRPYWAELYLLQGKVADADALLSSVNDLCPTFYTARALHLRAVATCREHGTLVSYPRLFAACFEAGDARQLAAVTRLVRRESRRGPEIDPDDQYDSELDLDRWKALVLYLRGDDRAFVERCRSLEWEDPRKIEPYRIRSLVRLGRGDEAVSAAHWLMNFGYRDYVDLYLYAHLAWRDPQKMIAAFDCLADDDRIVGDAYANPELGPILRSEAYRAVREKYPEPTKR